MKTTTRRTLLKALAVTPVFSLYPFSSFASHTRNKSNFLTDSSQGLKVSLNVYSFNALLREGKIDLLDLLDFCAEQNIDAIDATAYYFPEYPKVVEDTYLYQFKRKAFLLGVEISGTGIRNDFATPDPVKRQESIEHILQWIQAAAKMGAPTIRIFSGRGKYDGHTKEEVMHWMAKDIRTCCQYGKQFGVMIGLQNHNEFLKTADDIDQLIELVDSDWLGLMLDPASYREKNPYEETQQNIQHATTWQVKENVWIDGQQTTTDFVKLIRMIKASGYRGYLPIETLGEGDPYKKVVNLLGEVRKAMEETG